ncbi:FG-GAP repeat domain-containing protein [Polaribacter sp. Hel1_85]|uniref:FG-GAP repeat domain-containing protein n=1 Tax=Polaribacter sp. Hel1_85 TaxID=1250005 RepID=UPI000AAC7D57|nr:VCBS repeat-containing protein [Polaribacter sp. Hel1_85]
MPIRVFKNIEGNKFTEITEKLGLTNTTGWWFSIASGDFDNDGDIDFIAGNLGLNYKYKSSKDETFDIYFNDFDQNNKNDIVLSYYNEGKKFPVRGRSCSSSQVGQIKKQFKTYNEFSEATLIDVYGKDKLENSLHYQVNSFATTYLENKNGKFIMHALPNEAQLSSNNQILVKDFNKDGNLDVLMAGNLYASEIETPRNDAGTGVFLTGDGNGNFTPTSIDESGFYAPEDVKDMAIIKVGIQQKIIVANNNDYIQFISINK